ncbi:ubiquinol-cytochrome c reductase iron-sulfur subunit [Aquipuribacter hungaricus]|uniref:Cytochrome bc1 complex Rieske iron-sulfur subunit n=1 Tax=Aquipuribacter hungaricus TaxID=545624 RepID=A0ABV7WIL9_9MICO
MSAPTGHGASGASGATSPHHNVVSNAPGPAGPAAGTAVELPRSSTERFENPGLPPHVDRMADTDAKAAKRAERQVASLFVLSIVGTLLTLVGYFVVPLRDDTSAAAVLTSNVLLGTGLFLALFGIGTGAVHWAKTLMPDHEEVDERHAIEGSAAEQEEAVGIITTGVAESGIGRRPLIRNTLVGALALAPLPAVVLLKDTGPNPEGVLAETIWRAGDRLVTDPTGNPVLASDLVIGSVVHVQPQGIEESSHFLDEKAKAAVLLIRLEPDEVAESALAGSYAGIVAYSKICTHMGCPVALYEQTTQHLLCPCHQSTFDVAADCKVIFGPAARALPQLPIEVDGEGYLVAKSGFSEPVGPSYWEREKDEKRMSEESA